MIVLCFIIFTACSSSRDAVVYSGDVPRQLSRPIVLIGDTQATGFWEFWRESNNAFRKAILDKIASENPLFILHVGDLVFQGSSSSHWEEFDNNAQEIQKRRIPIFPVLGNHEYFGGNETALAHFFARFPAPHNHKWYSFRCDSLGFILLNSNFGDLSDEEIEQQAAWYKQELARFQADESISAIVTACHHPPFTNSTVVEPDEDVQHYFVSAFSATGKAKLFVTGHCHSYEHFEQEGKHFIVTGGGGGPRQKVKTDKPTYTDISPFARRKSELRPLHFCTLTTESNGALRVRMMQLDEESGAWSEGDSFVIP